ncbi:hypothetical protein B0H13DRAFT_1135694 [Mycena leptocephala]|nr:hypothetical protein B0H13DRAFT_1135694 [Mycena leptocephala]
MDDGLSLPRVYPSEETVAAFWRTIAYLTTRTRSIDGRWIGSPEVKSWNLQNTQTCDKCACRRTLKHCIVDEGQASCRPCRESKTACDRKLKFLFDCTREEFFPTFEAFMEVFNAKNQDQCRTFQKSANKRRKTAVPYPLIPKPKIVFDRPPAILASRLTNCECLTCGSYILDLLNELNLLRNRVMQLEQASRSNN